MTAVILEKLCSSCKVSQSSNLATIQSMSTDSITSLLLLESIRSKTMESFLKTQALFKTPVSTQAVLSYATRQEYKDPDLIDPNARKRGRPPKSSYNAEIDVNDKRRPFTSFKNYAHVIETAIREGSCNNFKSILEWMEHNVNQLLESYKHGVYQAFKREIERGNLFVNSAGIVSLEKAKVEENDSESDSEYLKKQKKCMKISDLNRTAVFCVCMRDWSMTGDSEFDFSMQETGHDHSF